MTTIEALASLIPPRLRNLSGKAFYSGRNAFTTPAPLYLLGLNPGGTPATDTIESHTRDVLQRFPDDWSAYRDESWRGAPPGTRGMAPRVLHVLNQLELDPGTVPASNLVFVRSRREADISPQEMHALANACWPFHASVIETLRPPAIVCFGKTTGRHVRERLDAHFLQTEHVEGNRRQWRTQVFSGSGTPLVVVATHPSIADWRAPDTDISALLRDVLR